jgi:hypothetical protein
VHSGQANSSLRWQWCEIDIRYAQLGSESLLRHLDALGVLEHRQVEPAEIERAGLASAAKRYGAAIPTGIATPPRGRASSTARRTAFSTCPAPRADAADWQPIDSMAREWTLEDAIAQDLGGIRPARLRPRANASAPQA